MSFPAAAVERYEELKKSRLNVGHNDLRIAATALVSGATVVTASTRDFARVPGLQLEDWTMPEGGCQMSECIVLATPLTPSPPLGRGRC